jgi:hypothetical protein
MSSIDLHLRSNYGTDGDFSPTELISFCLRAGITHAAIADHNSVKGIAEALSAAEGKNLELIPAIEMDCVITEMNLHLLGYGIDITNPVFDAVGAGMRKQEQQTSALLMRLIRNLGIDFDDDVIASLSIDGVVTGEMIAEAALLHDHTGKNALLDPYRKQGARSDNPYVNFYWDFCSQGKPAYIPMTFISLTEAIGIINSNGGVSVLAHPGVNIRENPALLKEVIATGVQGIEVFSSYHSTEQFQFYQQITQSHGLIMTCGSDFHGKTKKNIKIGKTECEGLEDQIIHALKQAISSTY